jgi:NAD(P)-dependent dehydrogenase (short-subunit alcohol dehydrogenase family)
VAGTLAGKRALVYGGGTGIGLACAEAMARDGAAIFLSGRREGVLREAAQQLAAIGKAGFAAGDATVVADVQRVTEAAVRFLGGLDTIVVSAGAGGRTPIFDTPVEEFQRINLAGLGYRCHFFDAAGGLFEPQRLPAHANGLFLPR